MNNEKNVSNLRHDDGKLLLRRSILDEQLETSIDWDAIARKHNNWNDRLAEVIVDVFSVKIYVYIVDVVLALLIWLDGRRQAIFGGQLEFVEIFAIARRDIIASLLLSLDLHFEILQELLDFVIFSVFFCVICAQIDNNDAGEEEPEADDGDREGETFIELHCDVVMPFGGFDS